MLNINYALYILVYVVIILVKEKLVSFFDDIDLKKNSETRKIIVQ